jgi:hypothetical protein
MRMSFARLWVSIAFAAGMLLADPFAPAARAQLILFNPGGHVSQTFTQSSLASPDVTNYSFLAPSANNTSGSSPPNSTLSHVDQSATLDGAQTTYIQTTNVSASAGGPVNGNVGNAENLLFFTPTSDVAFHLSRTGSSGDFTTEILNFTNVVDVVNVTSGSDGDFTGMLSAGKIYEVTIQARAVSGATLSSGGTATFTLSAIPEPASLTLTGLAAVIGFSAGTIRRRRQTKASRNI